MKTDRWFHCSRTVAASGDALTLLRERLDCLYASGDADGYSLVVVALAPEAGGFDRLAMRLSYARILSEATGVPAAMTGAALAVALINRDRNLSATLAMLRMRLGRATTTGRPPRVWLERLPAELPMAYELLDELSE